MANQMINIRELRNRQGLKLEYVAKKVGMSIPYLSQLERNKRTISYSDYIKILDVLGYEIKIQKKNDMEELGMNNEIIETNGVLANSDMQDLEIVKQTVLSEEAKTASEEIMSTLKELDQDTDMLIKAFKYAANYTEYEGESLIKHLGLLCVQDKELLNVLNTNLEKVIALGNKDVETWSKEEHNWYSNWSKFDGEIYDAGSYKRMKKFNVTAEEDNYGDPMTLRVYTLKNGTPISVMYWLNGGVAEYSYDIPTEKDGIYAIKETSELLQISDDREINVAAEEIMNQLLDEDKQEVIRIVKEAYDFEELFSAQLSATYALIRVMRSIIIDVHKTQIHPERYTDEYKEYIKQFYI